MSPTSKGADATRFLTDSLWSRPVLTVGAEHADVPSHSAESVDRQPAVAPESSPSTGAEEVADDMHAVYGLGDREPRATIESDEYLKDFFGVSS